MWER
jgi:hypothetical protein